MSLVKAGKYQFYISGFIDTDREGNPLVTKNGNNVGKPYRKMHLSVIGENECGDLYPYVYDSEKVRQIANSIGRPFEPAAKIDLNNLNEFFGESGTCIVVVKEGKQGYDPKNDVSLYIPKHIENATAKTVSVPAVFTKMAAEGMGTVETPTNDDFPF